eukprot:43879-Eustigmatos_ZCMA.PRE.1
MLEGISPGMGAAVASRREQKGAYHTYTAGTRVMLVIGGRAAAAGRDLRIGEDQNEVARR